MRIITVSREFGSGGREVGKRIADILGIAYYDNEILSAMASETSLDESYIEYMVNKGVNEIYPITFSHTFSSFYMMPNSTSSLLATQSGIIKNLAKHGDCVIVGRAADIILNEFNPFKIFVYADMKSKIERCRNRAEEEEKKLTDREFERKIKQIDRTRASNYNIISGHKWGDKHGYNFCINTTGMSIKDIAPYIAEYAKIWFKETGR